MLNSIEKINKASGKRSHKNPSSFIKPASSKPFIQPKLTVNRPGDSYEQEADAMADQVMRFSENNNDGKSITFQHMPIASIQRKCAACEEEGQVRRMVAPGESGSLMRKAEGGGFQASPQLGASLQSSKGGGTPLRGKTRQTMERSFGADFSEVRVHSGQQAAEMSQGIQAKAFTHGRDIYFNQGEYSPEGAAGKRLLAHELTHVVQQSSRSSLIQRAPGPATKLTVQQKWDQLVNRITYSPDSLSNRSLGTRTINRLLATAPGRRLVNELWGLFCRGASGCRTHLQIDFRDRFPAMYSKAKGYFEPRDSGFRQYRVYVKNDSQNDSNPYTDPESDMADALHHEALHVWFIHARPKARYKSGHEDEKMGEIDPEFFERLDRMSNALYQLETAIRRRNRKPEPSGPSRLGGEISFRGGGGKIGGARGTALVGADLAIALGRLNSLRLGARGIYLTPDQLLAGGTVGYRWYDEENKPFFFDMEAGILAKLTPSEGSRLRGSLAGFGSVGIGQEMGREGSRFFWRVGGFVIVSDKPLETGSRTSSPSQVGGGATVGVGARF